MNKRKQKSALALIKELEELFGEQQGYEISLKSLNPGEKGQEVVIEVYHDITMSSWEFLYTNGEYRGVNLFPQGFPFATRKKVNGVGMQEVGGLRRKQAIVINMRKYPFFTEKNTKIHYYFFDAIFDGRASSRQLPFPDIIEALRAYCEKFTITLPLVHGLAKAKSFQKKYRAIGFTDNWEYFFGNAIPGSEYFKKGNASRVKFKLRKKNNKLPQPEKLHNDIIGEFLIYP
jgi:hypothetical protein